MSRAGTVRSEAEARAALAGVGNSGHSSGMRGCLPGQPPASLAGPDLQMHRVLTISDQGPLAAWLILARLWRHVVGGPDDGARRKALVLLEHLRGWKGHS